MTEKLDPHTRVSKLRALGIADKYPKLLAQHALLVLEESADAAIAALEAAQASEREAARRLDDPIVVPWSPTPSGPSDFAVLCADRRPHSFVSTRVNGQLYVPALPSLSIGFLELALRSALPASASPGWSFGRLRDCVFLLDALGPTQAATIVLRLTSDQVPLLLCIYRAYAHATTAAEKSLAALAFKQLGQFGHVMGATSFVPAGERAERATHEREAERIWAMATADAAATAPEVDRETEQRHLTSVQLTAQLEKQSARAEREAAKALAAEAS